MTIKPIVDTRSEKGMALVVVLLLMAVLSGLATGFAMNGQTESAMAVNEVYYAGARAAAEAGMNRAITTIRVDNTRNLLAGPDLLLDAANPGAAVNADNGIVTNLLAGASPWAVDAAGTYRYTIRIFDDDDTELYDGVALTAAQLAAMGEPNGIDSEDQNDRFILRATGFGPSNTVVRLSRVLQSTENVNIIPASFVNPAILVDGDLQLDGNLNLLGDFGSVHANGNLDIEGASTTVEQDATSSGDFTAHQNFDAGGKQGGGYGAINVPTMNAIDKAGIADFILNDNGTITDAVTGLLCVGNCIPDMTAWTFADPDGLLGPQMGTWTISGSSAPEGTFFVEGHVSISGSPKGPGNVAIPMTLISLGSIDVSGNPKLIPDAPPDAADPTDPGNPEQFLFITDGDLKLGGSPGLDTTDVEGQIFVKEQMHMHGTPRFRGRIIVQNDANNFTLVNETEIDGTPTITYDGTLPGYQIPPSATTTYTNQFFGWIEQ